MQQYNSVEAILEILDDNAETACTVTNIDGAHVAIETRVPLHQSTLVKIERNGQMALGEIIQAEGYRGIIQIEHLLRLDGLAGSFARRNRGAAMNDY